MKWRLSRLCVFFGQGPKNNLMSTWILIKLSSLALIFCLSSGCIRKPIRELLKQRYVIKLHLAISYLWIFPALMCCDPSLFPWAIGMRTPGVFCVENPHHTVWSSINRLNISQRARKELYKLYFNSRNMESLNSYSGPSVQPIAWFFTIDCNFSEYVTFETGVLEGTIWFIVIECVWIRKIHLGFLNH